ncbi:MAG: hypothetical protein J3K34DRAFT_461664 [Monoraphidium minutum]|nr:MAG: hypothetical protein J3K34DRAFT_461664 [Monoraphidium minutum]
MARLTGDGGGGAAFGAGAGGGGFFAALSRGVGGDDAAAPPADGGRVSPLVAAALAPLVVWPLAWGLTVGLAGLGDAALGGMVGVAGALFPDLPVRGVGHEDVAVSLVKGLQAGTADDATWSRPGLGVPGWVMRGLMRLLFGTAVASTSVSAALSQTGPWMAACGASQAVLFALCLALALPVGMGLHRLLGWLAAVSSGSGGGDGNGASVGEGSGEAAPAAGSSAAADAANSSSTALSLRLAAALAWPCLSASAVGGALAPKAAAAAPFGLAIVRVVAAAAGVALLATVALTAARFARDAARGDAGDAAAVDFGRQVGLLCGAQAGLNAVLLLLGLVGGYGLSLRDVVAAAASSAVLARIASTAWLMGEAAAPSAWLRMLQLDTLLAR